MKVTKGGNWCSVPGCKSNSKEHTNLSFFRFPKDTERSKIWSTACGRKDLLQKDSTYCYINCKICGLHFENVMFLNFEKNRLKKYAVPTLFKDCTAASMLQDIKDDTRISSGSVHEEVSNSVQQTQGVKSQWHAVLDVLQSVEPASCIQRVPFLAVPDPSSCAQLSSASTCSRGDTATYLAVDGLKMEPESHNDSEAALPSGGFAKHEGISVTVPAMKCEAELNSHVIKAEPESDRAVQPVSSVSEDMKMEEKPMMFTFVSVNGEQEELRDLAAVKQELNVELAAEEHQWCCRSLDYQEESSRKRFQSAQFDCDIDRRVDTDLGSETVVADSRHEKHCEEGDCGTVSEVKQHVCHLCGKQFHRRRNLMIHKRIHTRQKSFGCDVCKKEFTGKGSLKTHFLIHTGEKPYRCEVCSKQFLKNGDLVRHKRVHTGEKPYICDVCSKTFSQRSSLTSHVRVHTGEKPFKCEVCGKEFSNSCNVVIHCRAHTGEKPYKCEVCLKVFSRWAVLAKHKRLHNRNTAEANTH